MISCYCLLDVGVCNRCGVSYQDATPGRRRVPSQPCPSPQLQRRNHALQKKRKIERLGGTFFCFTTVCGPNCDFRSFRTDFDLSHALRQNIFFKKKRRWPARVYLAPQPPPPPFPYCKWIDCWALLQLQSRTRLSALNPVLYSIGRSGTMGQSLTSIFCAAHTTISTKRRQFGYNSNRFRFA